MHLLFENYIEEIIAFTGFITDFLVFTDHQLIYYLLPSVSRFLRGILAFLAL